jgi:hypothetical protein
MSKAAAAAPKKVKTTAAPAVPVAAQSTAAAVTAAAPRGLPDGLPPLAPKRRFIMNAADELSVLMQVSSTLKTLVLFLCCYGTVITVPWLPFELIAYCRLCEKVAVDLPMCAPHGQTEKAYIAMARSLFEGKAIDVEGLRASSPAGTSEDELIRRLAANIRTRVK